MNAQTTPLPVLPPRPRGRPKAEDIEALEERLLSIARHIFFAHGYGATSMASIARAARVSKNTLYSRFGSKAALFDAVVRERLSRTDPLAGSTRKQSLEEGLRTYMEQIIRISLSGEILQINRLIYSEAGRFPELGQAASDRMLIGVDHVAQMLIAAAERDNIPCRDPRKAATLLLTLGRGWYGDILLKNSQLSGPEIRAIAHDIVALFIGGRSSW